MSRMVRYGIAQLAHYTLVVLIDSVRWRRTATNPAFQMAQLEWLQQLCLLLATHRDVLLFQSMPASGGEAYFALAME
jgi:hypothetical protein